MVDDLYKLSYSYKAISFSWAVDRHFPVVAQTPVVYVTLL